MGSLFNHSSCGCGSSNAGAAEHKKSEGCVCEVLNQLANTTTNLCSSGANTRVLIVNKGTSTPLDLLGLTTPTEFTVARFDAETSCAVFTYQDVNGAGDTITRTYVTDCRCICGIVCLNGL
ncbi:hypothetical protein ACFQPF_09030 [Fictibacillus iocasae]|uniref:Spore coat protein n=1 Tax=Fictibacillus iocasae TaxID=2715437 RepID=A0ABW2NR36_9BACL